MGNLYLRDYTNLTSEEKKAAEKAERFLDRKKKGARSAVVTAEELSYYHSLLSRANYHNQSLFPNHYIGFNSDQHNSPEDILSDFKRLVHNTESNERVLLNYIKEHEAYFILESLFDYYLFGHHDSYLFREFPLSHRYAVDFLLVGQNSGGYEFIFIEFEHPNKDITLKDGTLGNAFRKGIEQTKDWALFLESNFNTLSSTFLSIKNPSKEIPKEFFQYDSTRMHFLVIAGTRNDFNEKTYREKRMGKNRNMILHYDSLIDRCKSLLNVRNRSKANIT